MQKIFSQGKDVNQQRDLLVKIGIEMCDLLVYGLEQGLSLPQRHRSSGALLCCLDLMLARTFQGGKSRIQSLHQGQDLVTTHLDLDNALRLKNTSPSIDNNIHLICSELIDESRTTQAPPRSSPFGTM